ncbi:MAG: T9SS type A sorting domain-containing protein [Flavipsychrobacter sp.]
MRLYISILVMLFAVKSYGQTQNNKKLNALFIGNSYTAVNSLPQIVSDIAKSMGDTLTYGIEAPGGYYFLSHISVNPPATINKIKVGNWNYVILQEQSVNPAQPDNGVNTTLFPYAKRLDSLINLYNNCVETIFYMTWGRKNGDSFFCDYYTTKFNWPYYCSYNTMDSMIRIRYEQLGDSNNAILSPVGAIWRYIRNNYPNIELYDSDESHPSEAGSYAGACSFYTTLFRKDPTLIKYNYTLSTNDASNIRNAVKAVLYDSLQYWHVGQYRTEAGFSYTQNNATVNFNNLSVNNTSTTWYFGDGQFTNAPNPMHTYTSTGSHTVMQIAHDNISGCDDTAYAPINIFPTTINGIQPHISAITIPNPNNGIFKVGMNGKIVQISISDIYGREVYHNNTSPNFNINISNEPKGLYIMKVIDQDGEAIRKFLKL